MTTQLSAALLLLQAAVAADPTAKEVPDEVLHLVLPTEEHVVAEKAVEPASLALGFAEVLTEELLPLIEAASAAGLLEKAHSIIPPQNPPAPSDITAKIGDRVVRAHVDDWTRRLGLTARASELIDAVAAAPNPAAISDLATDMVNSVDVGAQASGIREALDVLSRWVAAHSAAATFGGGNDRLALMLALYRTEGDLAVPRSHLSLEALVPAYTEPGLQASIAKWKGVPFQLGWNSLILRADEPGTNVQMSRKARTAWLAHLAGHDRFLNAISPYGDYADMWSTTPPGVSLTENELEALVEALATDMVLRRARTQSGRLESGGLGASGFGTHEIRVAPKNPVALVQLALQLAFVLFDDLEHVSAIVTGAPPDLRWKDKATTYMLYNNQTEKTGDVEQPHRGVFGSAVGAIASRRDYREPTARGLQERFRELRTALRDSSAFGGPPVDPKNLTGAEVATKNGPFLDSWLSTEPDEEIEERAELLSFFLPRAGKDQWRSYPQHQANASRFRLLYSYYLQVLTGS